MNKFKSSIFIVLIIFILTGSNEVLSQQWLINPQFDNTNKEINFYDIQDAYYAWEQSRDSADLKGDKRFKRWEWYYEGKVYPSGKMPDPFVNHIEWEKNNNSISKINKTIKGNSAVWISISPNEVPPSTDEMVISGMGRINCLEFHPYNPNILWVGASQGGVWKSIDNGINWICLTDNLPLNRISDIEINPLNPDIIYIATGDIEYFGLNVLSAAYPSIYGLGIFKTTDGGINWYPSGMSYNLNEGDNSLIRRIFINPDNTEELVVAGISGIHKSNDGGLTWLQVYSEMIIDFDKNPLRDSTLYATGLYIPGEGGTNRVLKSVDFGSTWDTLSTSIIPLQSSILRSELEVSMTDTATIYILSCGLDEGFHALFKSEDAGNSWFVVAAKDTSGYSGSTKAPNIFGRADGGYFNNPFLPPDVGGQGTYDITLVIDPNNEDKIFTGGVNMWGSDDGGLTWDIVSFSMKHLGESIHADQHCSKFNPNNNTLYQANDGGIYKTNSINTANTDTIINCFDVFTMEIIPGCYELPTIWEDISSGLHITEYYKISTCLTHPGLIIGGTQDNGTFRLKNGLWQKLFGGDGGASMIDHFNPDVIYVTSQMGALNKSIDGGVTYINNLESPITNSGELGYWITPYIMHPQNPQIIYTGFQNVWKSTDGALSWTKISGIGTPGVYGSKSINTMAISPSNPDYIYVARRSAIFRTKDGGNQSWSPIHVGLPTSEATITSICVSDNDPENIWVSFNGYVNGEKVYHSTDAGDTWENITGDLPNVGANTIAFQSGTINGVSHAIYIGTDIGIYYTNDSIQQTPEKWSLYSEGLPNVIVTDINIQYGSQKLYAATYGRGLWETELFSPSVVEGIDVLSESEFNINVYPNPATDHINIKITNSGSNKITMELFNLNGNKIKEFHELYNNNFVSSIDINHLNPGTYILRISIENSDFTYKIIKTN